MDNNKIENIKIYGERNSGTNFLYELLQNNLIDVNLYSGSYLIKLGGNMVILKYI